jgi:ribokinase
MALVQVGQFDNPDPERCISSLLSRGPETVVITLGSEGCLVAMRGKIRETINPPKVNAVDTVGAGDVFNGALAVALGEHRPPVEAARWACTAAALAVTRPGAQSAAPTRGEIDRLASRGF